MWPLSSRPPCRRNWLIRKNRMQGLWAAMEESFGEFQKDLEAKVSRELIDLSIRIAEVIVRRELPDRSMIRDIVKETLEPLTDFQGAKVSLSPSEAAGLKESVGEKNSQDKLSWLEIVADESLGQGDVVVESRNGCFDARVTERLEILKERLMDRLQEYSCGRCQTLI